MGQEDGRACPPSEAARAARSRRLQPAAGADSGGRASRDPVKTKKACGGRYVVRCALCGASLHKDKGAGTFLRIMLAAPTGIEPVLSA